MLIRQKISAHNPALTGLQKENGFTLQSTLDIVFLARFGELRIKNILKQNSKINDRR